MIKKKLKNRKGFTLAEMLIALLITALAGMVALGGLVAAANHYRDIRIRSQAQMVMKEYMDSIRSVLISVSPDSGFEIFQETVGGTTRVYFANGKVNRAGYFTENGGSIVFQLIDPERNTDPLFSYTYHGANNSGVYNQIDLVPRRIAGGFTAELLNFTYNNGAFTGTVRLTSDAALSSGTQYVLNESFTVYPLNYHN